MCSWNCGKFKIFDKEVLNLDLKTWILAGKWKYLFLCFYFMVCFVWSVDLSIFFLMELCEKWNYKQIISYSSSKEDQKFIRRICHVKAL